MRPGSGGKGGCCMSRSRKGGRDSLYYYKWLDKALLDLQAARILMTWNGDACNIAFHCQQAIEKALKGYLLFKTGRHFDGHNLTYLCRQAVQQEQMAAIAQTISMLVIDKKKLKISQRRGF